MAKEFEESEFEKWFEKWMLSGLERWARGETPQITLSQDQAKRFLRELSDKGFEQNGEAVQVEGFSGPYYLYTLKDDLGNEVHVQTGGRMPTRVDVDEECLPILRDTLEK